MTTPRFDSAIKARSRGFTLMELLVVIAVIAMLAALLFPVFVGAREEARRTICLANLRQVGLAHRLYVQDYDEQFPAWWQQGPPRAEPFGPRVYWPELLRPYAVGQRITVDPSFDWGGAPAEGQKLADYTLPTWGPGGKGTERQPYFRWAGPELALAGMARPSQTVALLDGWTTTQFTLALGVGRHRGAVQVAFHDGHVQRLMPAELWRHAAGDDGVIYLYYATADR